MSSALEQTIQQIATAQGGVVTHVFGEHKSAERTTAPAIFWAPDHLPEIEFTFPERQEADEDTVVYTATERCTVDLWGAAGAGQTDYEVVRALIHSFVAACANDVGETVIELSRAVPMKENRHSNKGLLYRMSVGIKFPLYAEQLTTHTVLTIALDAAVVDQDWANRETAP